MTAPLLQITCVALLERMFLYSETVLMQSAEVSHPLADHMDRVAMEFHRMIGKHNLTGTRLVHVACMIVCVIHAYSVVLYNVL